MVLIPLKMSLIIAAMLALALPRARGGDPFKVYIMAGQSNMQGPGAC